MRSITRQVHFTYSFVIILVDGAALVFFLLVASSMNFSGSANVKIERE
jgi:hypothetical protein